MCACFFDVQRIQVVMHGTIISLKQITCLLLFVMCTLCVEQSHAQDVQACFLNEEKVNDDEFLQRKSSRPLNKKNCRRCASAVFSCKGLLISLEKKIPHLGRRTIDYRPARYRL